MPSVVGPGASSIVQTDTPWVAPSNEDIELEPDALSTLLRTGEAHPEAGIVAPRLILPDGSTQHSVFSFPTLLFTLLYNLGVVRLTPRIADRYCLDGASDPDRPREVPWAIATFYVVRREAWDQIGGFRSRAVHPRRGPVPRLGARRSRLAHTLRTRGADRPHG
jgi:GT2 family glycosyltransferase